MLFFVVLTLTLSPVSLYTYQTTTLPAVHAPFPDATSNSSLFGINHSGCPSLLLFVTHWINPKCLIYLCVTYFCFSIKTPSEQVTRFSREYCWSLCHQSRSAAMSKPDANQHIFLVEPLFVRNLPFPICLVRTECNAVTVSLPTHILCKLAHLFFSIFQATMFNSLPTSFYKILNDKPDKETMYAIPPQGYFQRQTCDDLSTHFPLLF